MQGTVQLMLQLKKHIFDELARCCRRVEVKIVGQKRMVVLRP